MQRALNLAQTIVPLARRNPRLFLKRLLLKLKSLQPLPPSPVTKTINGILFPFDFEFDPLIQKMYVGSYELETVEVMKSLLNEGDVFIDVGANIGYISAIGLSLVGKTGEVHSFEPVPRYFEKLQTLAALNPQHKLVANPNAVGAQPGTAMIDITSSANIGWNTMVPGFMAGDAQRTTVDVSVVRLADYIEQKRLGAIKLIKIDTEGYEFPILQGLQGYLENTQHRPAILCEIAPGAYRLLGSTLAELAAYMNQYGYGAYDVDKPGHLVELTTITQTTNVLFRAGV